MRSGIDDGRDVEHEGAWDQGASDEICGDNVASNLIEEDEVPGPPKKWQDIDRLRSFDDLIGQDKVRDALKARVLAGRTRDHIILYGAHGVGKKALGALYGQAIVCSSPIASEKPCGSCMGCEDFVSAGFNGHWYDLEAMLAANMGKGREGLWRALSTGDTNRKSGRKALNKLSDDLVGICKTIRQGSLARIFSCDNLVILIDKAELMLAEPADRFLQGLEDPGSPTTCIFVTHDLRHLRPALRSRCQAYRLAPLDRNRAMKRLVRACDRLSIIPHNSVLEVVAGRAGYRAGSMLQHLWHVYQAGSVTMLQARTALGLDWVGLVHHALSMMVSGDQEQVLAAFGGLGKEPREALNRLRTTMRALDAFELNQSRDANGVLPFAFVYADDHLISSLRALLVEAAARIAMEPDEHRAWLMSRLNGIHSSRSTSISAEMLLLSQEMRGGR